MLNAGNRVTASQARGQHRLRQRKSKNAATLSKKTYNKQHYTTASEIVSE